MADAGTTGAGRASTTAQARARAWAQAQAQAAASGRPYADPGSAALDTDKRGAGRDGDALRAVPSAVAAMLAATGGDRALADAGAPGAPGQGAGASRDATGGDQPATNPGPADGAAGTGVYVPGVSAPGFGARIEAIPAPPSGVHVTALAGGVRVSWTHSGENVNHYLATAYDGSGNAVGNCSSNDPSVTTCDIVNGIQTGQSYTAGVLAYGSADASEPSSEVSAGASVTVGPPAAPSGVHAMGASPTSLVVSWTASSSDSSTIDHYVVVADQDPSKGCSTANGSTLHCLVDTLSSDTAYSFRVSAVGLGQAGDSDPSASSDPLTPGPPDPPTNVIAAQNGDNTLRVSWTAPAQVRAGVSKYVAMAVEDATITCETSDGSATSCDIGNLTPGGPAYTFRVQAKGVSSSGDSAWSTASASAVVTGPPDAPTGIMVTPGDGSLTVQWTPPVNHGAGIDHYTAWTAEDHTLTCGTADDTAHTCTITGLTNAMPYTVQVAAFGTGTSGNSGWASAAAVTPSRAPAAPTGIVATAKAESIWVSWTAGDPGSGVAGFRASASAHGESHTCEAAATASGCLITGLTAGTAYTVSVLASGQYGRDSAWATATSATPAALTVPAEVPPSAGHVDSSSGTDVAPGEAITLGGSGYAPNTAITVVIYSAPQTLASTMTDGSGAFSVSVTVPAGYSGPHTLVASGVDGTGTPRYLTLGVDVTAHAGGGAPAMPVGHDTIPGGDLGASDSMGSLPVTGDPISSIAMLGLCLLLAGLAFVTLSRLRFAAGPAGDPDQAA